MEKLLSMEVYQIHEPHKVYWEKEGSELLCAMNYENIMSHPRFDNIMRHIQLLLNIDDDQQSLDFIEKWRMESFKIILHQEAISSLMSQ